MPRAGRLREVVAAVKSLVSRLLERNEVEVHNARIDAKRAVKLTKREALRTGLPGDIARANQALKRLKELTK